MPRRCLALVAATTLLTGLLAGVLTGCGAAGEANPEKIGPQGVDQLVIPTPSPDPRDFVRGVDNPWFPLAPGTVWTYDVTGSRAVRMEVGVDADEQVVDGVRCVVVHEVATDQGGKVVSRSGAFYAQDQQGNVWLFGESGDRAWRAGQSGAEAGLLMPAKPRVGDGWLQEEAPGVVADRSTALSLDAERTVPAGTFGGLLLLEDSSTLSDLHTVQRTYARGTGLVSATTTAGGTEGLSLVSVTVPAA
jgi:hypothetical protein